MSAVRGEQCFVDPLGHHQDLLEGGDSLVGPQPEANAQVDEGAAGNVGDVAAVPSTCAIVFCREDAGLLAPGERLGRYELTAPLGSSGDDAGCDGELARASMLLSAMELPAEAEDVRVLAALRQARSSSRRA